MDLVVLKNASEIQHFPNQYIDECNKIITFNVLKDFEGKRKNCSFVFCTIHIVFILFTPFISDFAN